MKILVLNGSPKAKYSITVQTILYLQKQFPEHAFEFVPVGQKVKAFESDFSTVKQKMEMADLILFSYPVYTFLVPSQFHRFIELMKENKVNLDGKFVTQFSTSKHFYDVTAHKFIEENCKDLNMKYIPGLSADMDDLLTDKGQKQAKDFMKHVIWCTENDIYEEIHRSSSPENKYMSKAVHEKDSNCEIQKDGDIVIISDLTEEDIQLKSMIQRFQSVISKSSRVVNLSEFPFHGGCLGCFNCATTGKCIHTDGFDEFLRTKIQTADAIVFAFTIKDHSMGALFKMYDDRQFCNGHRTVTMGMPIGYLISGAYHEEPNLQMVIEARAQVGGNYLAGIATDEVNPDREIDQMAENLVYALENEYVPPQNFYGIGGMKIFRDMIYLMQGMMKADHKFYKEHQQYDFPQKKKGTILKMYVVGALLSSTKVKAKMGNKMNEGMIMPYRKVIAKQ